MEMVDKTPKPDIFSLKLNGLFSDSDWRYLFAGMAMSQISADWENQHLVAIHAVRFADALLAELKKEKK